MAAKTKAKPEEKPKREKYEPTPTHEKPVHVDNRTARSDQDGLIGHTVEVIAGEHKGLRGVLETVDSYEKDGYPHSVVLRNRYVSGVLYPVLYKDVRPAPTAREGT